MHSRQMRGVHIVREYYVENNFFFIALVVLFISKSKIFLIPPHTSSMGVLTAWHTRKVTTTTSHLCAINCRLRPPRHFPPFKAAGHASRSKLQTS